MPSSRLRGLLDDRRRLLTRAIQRETIPISIQGSSGAAAQFNGIVSLMGDHEGYNALR